MPDRDVVLAKTAAIERRLRRIHSANCVALASFGEPAMNH